MIIMHSCGINNNWLMFHVEQINKSRKMFYVEQSRGEQKGPYGPLRLSKKWLNATFSSFFHPVLAPMARSAPNAKYENLWVFIRSDAHPPGGLLLPLRGNSPCVVRAGLNIRGCGPLSTLGFFDRLKGPCGPLCHIALRTDIGLFKKHVFRYIHGYFQAFSRHVQICSHNGAAAIYPARPLFLYKMRYAFLFKCAGYHQLTRAHKP